MNFDVSQMPVRNHLKTIFFVFAFCLASCSKQSEIMWMSVDVTPTPISTPIIKPLALAADSESTLPVTSRVFSGGIWTLTGTCNTTLGDVLIGGNGIIAIAQNNPTYTTPCSFEGSFSVVINSVCGAAPCMNGYSPEITIFQPGGFYKTTRIYDDVGTLVTTGVELRTAMLAGGIITLANDIDLSSIPNWTWIDATVNPIVLNGDGHTISNLNFTSGSWSNIGFIRQADARTKIRDVSFTNANVAATGDNIGGVIGYADQTHLSNVSFGGQVMGGNYVGGLIGYQNNGANAFLKDCSTSGSSIATTSGAGGLVGYGFDLNIIRSFSSSTLNGGTLIGGLVGESDSNSGGTLIQDSFSSGSITCTSSGCVTAGLIAYVAGQNSNRASILRTYFSGYVHAPVTGITDALVASKNSYVDITSSYYQQGLMCDQCALVYGTPLSLPQLKQSSFFVGWDFSTPIWANQTDGVTMPKPRR